MGRLARCAVKRTRCPLSRDPRTAPLPARRSAAALAAAAVALAAAAFAAAPALPAAHAHTIDAVGEYRIEIGWMNEPVVSGETNGIELYISPLAPCPSIDVPMDCAASQEFADGIGGLEDDLQVQLVYRGEKIWLPLSADHNTEGKYYAFVNPTVSGYYQANLIGELPTTRVSLSMHPPKVDERAYIEFPAPADAKVREIAAEHVNITGDLDSIRSDLDALAAEVRAGAADATPSQYPAGPSELDGAMTEPEAAYAASLDASTAYAAIGLGIAALAAASAALALVAKSRRGR